MGSLVDLLWFEHVYIKREKTIYSGGRGAGGVYTVVVIGSNV